MGNNVINTIRFHELTKEMIANYIKHVDDEYEIYESLIIELRIDGEVLSNIQDKDIKLFLNDLGITNIKHVTHLSLEFQKTKQLFQQHHFKNHSSSSNHNHKATSDVCIGKFESSSTYLELFHNLPNNQHHTNTDTTTTTTTTKELTTLSHTHDYELMKKIQSLYKSIEQECILNDHGKWKEEYEYVVHKKAHEKVIMI